ncbi:helix-turn-helix domain-containing protein [Symmachiella dynata]|mgnify:CR=1 FL=1|uniref:MarR family transcriptional regulator n=1 Tax=Symmachiella dynata TaxID=2527995 RepID=UPI0030EC3839
MDSDKFARIAETLRQYRRAELRDFQSELGENPIDTLYVDPLPRNAVLNSVLSGNTTFLLGRKGTGKSTIFAKAQSVYRGSRDVLSVYIDVKALYELISPEDMPATLAEHKIEPVIFRAHILRKAFLGTVVSELIKEIDKTCDTMSFLESFRGVKRTYSELQASLKALSHQIRESKLETHEIPVLQTISRQWRAQIKSEHGKNASVDINSNASTTGVKLGLDSNISAFDKALEDSEVYKEYSEIILQSYPFSELLEDIKELLEEARMARLVIFFDDFSELNFIDQKLFVDVVLSPLNNASNESVKLKIAGYPGRVYYGKIDPSKVDTTCIDFCSLYEASEVQEMESAAIDYATRLLETRFNAFGEQVAEYFDPAVPMEDHMKVMFQASFNVPRIMGSLLHTNFFDRISKGQTISHASIRLASRKYYESTIAQYFDRLIRYALEPFENKLDRHNQKQLLEFVIAEARDVRKKIQDGSLGGTFFKELGNPPTSHFVVQPSLEPLLRSLEANFLVSKYKDTRDKNGDPVAVYALYYGITETHRMSWGYPPGREYRNYFVQRCFDYSRAVQGFLEQTQTIRCNHCGACFPMEKEESFELFKWLCPECKQGTCSVVILAEEFRTEYDQLKKDVMLEPIELDILGTIHDENTQMRAGEISALLDVTYQLVGRRTSKMQEMGLVVKERNAADGHMRNAISKHAIDTYFSN